MLRDFDPMIHSMDQTIPIPTRRRSLPKKNRKKNNTDDGIMGSLPYEIVSRILSLLPFDSVIQCRDVCTSWRRLIAQPAFDKLYTEQKHTPPSTATDHHDSLVGVGGYIVSVHKGLLYIVDPNETKYHLYLGDYTTSSINEIKKKPAYSIGNIVGSCNGLICSLYNTYLDKENSRCGFDLLVLNPFTGEHVKLPRVYMDTLVNGDDTLWVGDTPWDHDAPCDNETTWGFGWHSNTNEYKVVGINSRPSIGQVQVYTLGRGNVWRDKGEDSSLLEPRYSLYSGSTSRGFFLDGCLHWLKRHELGMEILSLDLGDEKLVRKIPLLQFGPSYDPHTSYYELVVLGRRLCVNVHKRPRTAIWMLENKLWIKKSELEWELSDNGSEWPDCRDYRPIAMLGSGKFLLLSTSFEKKTMDVAFYDEETETLEPIKSLGDTEFVDRRRRYGNYTSFEDFGVKILPLSKSFVSLKALVENASTIW